MAHDSSSLRVISLYEIDASNPENSQSTLFKLRDSSVIADALDLNRRLTHINRVLAHLNRAAEERDEQRNDARREAEAIDAEHAALLDRQEQEAMDALLDAQDAGDLDRNGEPIPYDRYYGGV